MEGKDCWVMEMRAKCKDQGEPRLELLLRSMQPDGAKRRTLMQWPSATQPKRPGCLSALCIQLRLHMVQNSNLLGKVTRDPMRPPRQHHILPDPRHTGADPRCKNTYHNRTNRQSKAQPWTWWFWKLLIMYKHNY